MSKVLRFPDGFLWGTATASYQVEGAVGEDGRGVSIWDTFSHTPGKVFHGDTGDIAADHYHRWEDDVALMAGLGLNAYRFSIAWPRVQPAGSGPYEQRGLDFYRRLVDRLGEHGIVPAATLYHWDLPQPLQDAGGWSSRDTAERFAEYAHGVVAALGGVGMWITLNEPWVAAFMGYGLGHHAPGAADLATALRASHHLLLGHGLAVEAARAAMGPGTTVGITLNLFPCRPASDSAADADAATRVDGYHNRWFLDPVFRGEYPKDLAGIFSGTTRNDHIQPGDLQRISTPVDFLGVNYYTRHTAANRADPPLAGDRPYPGVLRAVQRPPAEIPRTMKGWTIEPDGLTELLARIRADYGEIPLYITENGAAFADYVDPDGNVKDPERIDYLERHLEAAHSALADGADLRGYFCWSLMDNFEWADGYSQRFGLVWVDYKRQERIPKQSAAWYSDVVRRNALEIGRRP